MNSFMFTFSAQQTSLQLNLEQKQQYCPVQTFRRRPTSSNASGQDKVKKSSSNDNQLFENPHNLSKNLEESPEKGLNLLKIKNSSMQLQQKKKLRSIIDTMLGKNFDLENNPKLDSIVFTNRKNLNKQRSYLTGTKKNQQKSKEFNDNDSKQNHPNDQNINNQSYMEGLQNMQKINKPNLKLRKFEFAAIKISKKSQYSQRYPELQKEEETFSNQNQPLGNRKCVNISRQSIDRQSLGKKLIKSKTPKIMYPQSDSKLPSVFRTNKHRNSIAESLKKRTRISSANYLPQVEDRIIQQEPVIIKKKRTIQYPSHMNNQVATRSKFRPKSTMIQTKRYLSQYQKNDYLPSQFYPKKLVFDNNQQLNDDINRKLGSNHIDSSHNSGNVIRITTRAKSTHVNYVHRKLREINSTQHMNSFYQNESHELIKNESHELIKNNSAQTKQTTEQSTMQSSMSNELHNMSENFVNSIELRQFGLGYSVTFQVQKQ